MHYTISMQGSTNTTIYGSFPFPSEDLTRLVLDLVHYAEGERIFTYVLTLDAHWRFTETGREFGIDLLSKHTMHSDVSIYIAYSGEFFIRCLKQHRLASNPSTSSPPPRHPPRKLLAQQSTKTTHPPHPKTPP